MNKLIKLFLCTIIFAGLASRAFAADSIDSVIKKSPINNGATIAVSVKSTKTGRVLYEYNQNKLLNPASALKPFTMKPAYEILGSDYTFNTQLFKDEQNNLYIKLSGDPSFSSSQLNELLKQYNGPVKDVIIDASANDYIEWGTGWMWDDDTNPYLPKLSQTTINENKINIEIKPGINGKPPEIRNGSLYQTVLVNLLTNGSKNDVKVLRQPWRSADITLLEGTVNTPLNITLPVDSTERYFICCVKNALSTAHLKPTGTVKIAPLNQNAVAIGNVYSDNLKGLVGNILKNSNNLYAELIFKTAGGKYAQSQGNTIDAIKMFEKYYSDITAAKPVIVDASGASRNDMVSVDWMTDALNKIAKDKNAQEYETLFAKPIEGTLSNRLLEVSQRLRAKTGSINNVSALTGYIDAKSGNKYSFAIIIQNYTEPTKDVKALEDEIVKAICNY